MPLLPQRKSQRLFGYDYSTNNKYFITSNVKDFVKCLGYVSNGKMQLNIYGWIVENQIKWLENHYSYVVIHSFVVMPDHFHLIIEIDSTKNEEGQKIKSISELIGALKSRSSNKIRKGGYAKFQWHRSFYDRIIRDNFELIRIQEYIDQNPIRWGERKN